MRQFIENIYSAHKDNMNMFGFAPEECDDARKDHYVYAWYVRTEPKRYFYIGKGKSLRYKHILKEIDVYENNIKKYKGQKYKYLKDEFGIEFEFLYKNLTEKEATILEAYCIMKYLKKKEPLLNVILPAICMEDHGLMDWRNSYFYEKDVYKYLNAYR